MPVQIHAAVVVYVRKVPDASMYVPASSENVVGCPVALVNRNVAMVFTSGVVATLDAETLGAMDDSPTSSTLAADSLMRIFTLLLPFLRLFRSSRQTRLAREGLVQACPATRSTRRSPLREAVGLRVEFSLGAEGGGTASSAPTLQLVLVHHANDDGLRIDENRLDHVDHLLPGHYVID